MDTFKLQLELLKIRALVNCLDDAIVSAVTYNPSDAGDRALCLIDILQESLDALIASAEDPERGAA